MTRSIIQENGYSIIRYLLGLDSIGMPKYIASGIHDKLTSNSPRRGPRRGKNTVPDGSKYRFLVMQRFGEDLQSILNQLNNKLDLKAAYTIAIKIIDILEYIHSFHYIHADIKASNLLLSSQNDQNSLNAAHKDIFLVDYGLVEKYMDPQGDYSLSQL